MALTDEEVPVLHDVVRNGDETIIRSSRLQRVDIDELDTTSTGPLHFELPLHLQFDILSHDSENDAHPDFEDALQPEEPLPEAALEALIDEIVDNHIISLRKELRSLLKRARDLP